MRENSSAGIMDEFSLNSCEASKTELQTALWSMATHVIKICELPHGMRNSLTVLGVSISYNDDDIQGLVITCERTLTGSNSPMIINTPHFSREPYSETSDPDIGVFSSEYADSLDDLEKRAFAHVDGDRAQRELEFKRPEETEDVELIGELQ